MLIKEEFIFHMSELCMNLHESMHPGADSFRLNERKVVCRALFFKLSQHIAAYDEVVDTLKKVRCKKHSSGCSCDHKAVFCFLFQRPINRANFLRSFTLVVPLLSK
jgi:hypothetical protein